MFNLENALSELPETKRNVSALYFKQSVYTRWATEDVFKYINAHPEWTTTIAIEHYIAMVDKFIYTSATFEMSWVFSIAKDTAEYLRDWSIAEEFRSKGE